MRKKVTDYTLYRWRHILGYGGIGLAIAGLLLVAALYIPGGLSDSEIRSVVLGNAISLTQLTPESAIHLPYRLLQQASIDMLGLSQFSIKLPSLILSIMSIIGMVLLLKSWFKSNVAVLTTILVVTASQFLALAQSGSAGITYVFCSVWILVAALRVSRHVKHSAAWKVVLFTVAALSLYTPLSIYILLALLSATILHPHLRYLARRALKSPLKIAAATVSALIVIAPLGWAMYLEPRIGLTLLGIPAEWPDINANIANLFHQYFNFVTPTSGVFVQPIYALGPLLLIILGVIQLVTTNYTARSYIITSWSLLLIPALIINPTYTSVTFVPAMLLMAMGVNFLLASWYRLFPKNPYARIAGLIPLIILIASMVFSGVSRYTYGYLYNPATASNFNRDTQLVNRELASTSDPVVLIVSPEEVPYYTIIAEHAGEHVSVSTSQSLGKEPARAIVTHDAHMIIGTTRTPHRIITDHVTQQADRFYVYIDRSEK